jgi:hypothetical protein
VRLWQGVADVRIFLVSDKYLLSDARKKRAEAASELVCRLELASQDLGAGRRRWGGRLTMRHDYYDRQGKPTDEEDWSVKFRDADYRRVASTVLADGKWVSTVWFGLDPGDDSGAPLIFETNVFDSQDGARRSCLQCKQYSTEGEALAGHKRLVDQWITR